MFNWGNIPANRRFQRQPFNLIKFLKGPRHCFWWITNKMFVSFPFANLLDARFTFPANIYFISVRVCVCVCVADFCLPPEINGTFWNLITLASRLRGKFDFSRDFCKYYGKIGFSLYVNEINNITIFSACDIFFLNVTMYNIKMHI